VTDGPGRELGSQSCESGPCIVGVIGWPVAHSLSPAMHHAALEALGLDWRYLALPVAPDSVGDALRGIRALGFLGVNVTVPHKTAVISFLDTVAPEAAALGAVNTVVVRRRDGESASLHGYNTDVAGFTGALLAGGYDPSGSRCAVVVGAGGAARAVAYALTTSGQGKVKVLNRTLARAEALITDLREAGVGAGRLEAVELTRDSLPALGHEADLLVNATTVGMWPHTEASVWPEGVALPAGLTVYDLVYNPLETRLLHQARRSGARCIDGLGMLARQGTLALVLWLEATGKVGTIDVDRTSELMRDACAQALRYGRLAQ
jgi:shikimate dehydrogenase